MCDSTAAKVFLNIPQVKRNKSCLSFACFKQYSVRCVQKTFAATVAFKYV